MPTKHLRLLPVSARRFPKQERSLDRVEEILTASARLIGTFGFSNFKMTDIAKEAQIPIGSVYQYFCSKTSIVETLFVRYLSDFKDEIFFDTINSPSLEIIIDKIFDNIKRLYSRISENPEIIEIWFAATTDPTLRKVGIMAAKTLASKFLECARHLLNYLDFEAVENSFTFLFYLQASATKMSTLSDARSSEYFFAEWKFLFSQSVLRYKQY